MGQRVSSHVALMALYFSVASLLPHPASAAAAAPKPTPKSALKVEERVVLIAGDKSSGTGFKARFAGKFCVVSTASLFWGNSTVKLTDMKGGELACTGTWLCRKQASDGASTLDLVLFELKAAPTEFFDLDAGPRASPTSATAVSAYGNSAKAQVISRTKGRVSGIGPERFEVSIRFVPGNSGSPVVLDADDSLVGVATCPAPETYPTWVTQGAARAEIRNFATRVDTVKAEDFEKLDLEVYRQDLAVLARAAAVNAAGIYVVTGLCYSGSLDVEKIADMNLRFQVRQWLDEKKLTNVTRRIPAQESRVRSMQNFLRFPDALTAGGAPVVLHYERSRLLFDKEKKINTTIVERLKKLEESLRTQSVERKLL